MGGGALGSAAMAIVGYDQILVTWALYAGPLDFSDEFAVASDGTGYVAYLNSNY